MAPSSRYVSAMRKTRAEAMIQDRMAAGPATPAAARTPNSQPDPIWALTPNNNNCVSDKFRLSPLSADSNDPRSSLCAILMVNTSLCLTSFEGFQFKPARSARDSGLRELFEIVQCCLNTARVLSRCTYDAAAGGSISGSWRLTAATPGAHEAYVMCHIKPGCRALLPKSWH